MSAPSNMSLVPIAFPLLGTQVSVLRHDAPMVEGLFEKVVVTPDGLPVWAVIAHTARRFGPDGDLEGSEPRRTLIPWREVRAMTWNNPA